MVMDVSEFGNAAAVNREVSLQHLRRKMWEKGDLSHLRIYKTSHVRRKIKKYFKLVLSKKYVHASINFH